MNKKIAIALSVVTILGVGGISSVAFQAHAQKVADVNTGVPAIQVPTTVTASTTISDTDNIQNDVGGIDQPDAVVQQGTDKETNDDTISSSKKTDVQENGHETADTPGSSNEVENAN